MYCKDCLSFGVCRYASGSRLLEKEPCADFMDFDKWVYLPCKVGDILYEPTGSGTTREYTVKDVRLKIFIDVCGGGQTQSMCISASQRNKCHKREERESNDE